MSALTTSGRVPCPVCLRDLAPTRGNRRIPPHNRPAQRRGDPGVQCPGSRTELNPPRPPAGIRIAIDADCPRCDYPERFFDPARGVFGCSSLNPNPCGYESTERDA